MKTKFNFHFLTIVISVIIVSTFSISNMHGFINFYDKQNPKLENERLGIPSYAAYVVMDYNSGKILSSSGENKRMYPASLTKLMTLFLVFDKLRSHEINFDTKIKVSQKAASQQPVKLGIPAGSTITVRDAILAVIVKSHNDMAYALAETVAGGEKEFISLMNEKAQELGLQNTQFATVNGFHKNNQYTTALDMAKLSRALMITHNAFYSLFSVSSFDWKKAHYTNTNNLLGDNRIDGIKTGYTNASGYNLVSSAQQNNLRIVAAVMGFRSANGRDSYMKQAIDDGFHNAKIDRTNSLKYLSKPKNLTTENLTITHETYSVEKLQENSEYKENAEIPSTSIADLVKDVHVPTDDMATSYGYTINKVSYLESITSSNKIFISPSVKYVKSTKSKPIVNKYKIQVGAFSSYKSALNEAYNVASIKAVARILPKKNIAIDKQSAYYVAKFVNLSRAKAYEACSILKTKGADCFVLSS